jgi:hypothetical protein
VGGASSLLTSDIGSGKSTVVDGISSLLLPASKMEYNNAAGAQKKEGTLKRTGFQDNSGRTARFAHCYCAKDAFTLRLKPWSKPGGSILPQQ